MGAAARTRPDPFPLGGWTTALFMGSDREPGLTLHSWKPPPGDGAICRASTLVLKLVERREAAAHWGPTDLVCPLSSSPAPSLSRAGLPWPTTRSPTQERAAVLRDTGRGPCGARAQKQRGQKAQWHGGRFFGLSAPGRVQAWPASAGSGRQRITEA